MFQIAEAIRTGGASRSRKVCLIKPLVDRLRIGDAATYVWPISALCKETSIEEVGDVTTRYPNWKRRTRLRGNDPRKLPSAKRPLQQAALIAVKDWERIDEVDEGDIRAVERRRADIVAPTGIGIGGVIKIAATAIASRRIDCFGIRIAELQLQVLLHG